MVNKKILALLVVVIVVVAAAIAVWQLTQAPSPEARSIKIGLVAPYKSPIGQDMDRAARMAVDEINSAGGIYVAEWHTSVQIELVIADTQDDAPGNAVTPVQRAVDEDKVDLLIGGYASAGTLANEIVAIENRVPYIITGASNRLVTRRGPQANYGGLAIGDPLRVNDTEGMSYIFHYCTTTYHYSKTVVDFFGTVMKPLLDSTYHFDSSRQFRLAVLYRDDAFGQGVLAASKYWIQNESLPVKIVAERKYPTTTIAFQADLTAVKAATPDAVFVVDNPDRTPEIIKQGINDVGLKTVYIAVENNEDPVFYKLLGKTGDKQLLESKFAPYGPPYYLPAIGTYVAAFKQEYENVTPGMMGADTYDAFFIAKNAIERAGTIDKKAVRDAIETTDMGQMLIMMQTGIVKFSTGLDYHEISPLTFIDQLMWNETIGECRPVIVWPKSVPGVGVFPTQTNFTLPTGYEPGS